ncbi:MAG: hypothetical protein KDI74_04880 [Gammaproteobacteria bacterium]|nr:hypothetical protein [Gammaproteobacteria bacterium]
MRFSSIHGTHFTRSISWPFQLYHASFPLKYGSRRDGELFDYKGEKFSNFSTALQFAHEKENKRDKVPPSS